MPNHVHGILWLLDADEMQGQLTGLPADEHSISGAFHGRGAASSAPTLGAVLRAFKSLSALAVNRQLQRSGPLWQRNYYERVIRNERELYAIRQYILDNPQRWEMDRENVDAVVG